MQFKIAAVNLQGESKVLYYDNMTNELKDADTVYKLPDAPVQETEQLDLLEPERFKKSKYITTLKIQLGMSCNYSCTYCSQRFVARPEETTKSHIEQFMQKLSVLNFDESSGLRIEFWGGEPFVYFKTLKPLVAAMNERFANWQNKPRYSVITNGSLLTTEINDWLVENNFNVSISHDGPGQSVRGLDPFDDEKIAAAIFDLYARLKPDNKISLNAMLNKNNQSRKDIHNWFIEKFNDPNIILGEGAIVDPYDEGGYESTLVTDEDHYKFRKQAFSEILVNKGNIGFYGMIQKIDSFINRVLNQKDASRLGQKCGQDDPHTLAVDLKGNVITCQNVSAVQKAPNGSSHFSGLLDDYDNVKVTSSTHWKDRPNCTDCPVLSLCQGSCMFLQDEYWDRACDNSYSDNVVFFALAIEKITGLIPVFISGDHLPQNRRDIWGDLTPTDNSSQIA